MIKFRGDGNQWWSLTAGGFFQEGRDHDQVLLSKAGSKRFVVTVSRAEWTVYTFVLIGEYDCSV